MTFSLTALTLPRIISPCQFKPFAAFPLVQHKFFLSGPTGRLEASLTDPDGAQRGLALVAHPHSLHGGTMDNKVVQTLVKAFAELGYVAARLNFRGVGQSEGGYDDGVGETEDMLALATHLQSEIGELPLLLAGFSFGGYVQTRVAARVAVQRLVLIAPAVSRFPAGPVNDPANTVVIHGEADEVVPLAAVFDWARPQNLPVTVAPGVGHFFHGQLALLKQMVIHACRC